MGGGGQRRDGVHPRRWNAEEAASSVAGAERILQEDRREEEGEETGGASKRGPGKGGESL